MPVSSHGDYTIDDDLLRIDWPRVHSWLSSSYWSPGIPQDRIEKAARHSALVLSAYFGAEQVGFLRVVSDCVRFAYLCDVWVDQAHRGRGLARTMVRRALEHEDFQTTRWYLATLDAHGVYKEIGFEPLPEPERWMMRNPARRL